MAREKLYGTPVKFKPEKVTNLTESGLKPTDPGYTGGLLILEGRIQHAHLINANNRRYGLKLWERVLSDPSFQERLRNGEVIGHLEHPQDGNTRYDRIPSHRMLEAKLMPDGSVWGRILVLDTTTGREIAAMVRGGCSIGISSRGDGEVTMTEGFQDVVPDTFTLDTWDLVHDNSVPGARVSPGGGWATRTESTTSASIPVSTATAPASSNKDDDETKLEDLQKKLKALQMDTSAKQEDISKLLHSIAQKKRASLSKTESKPSSTRSPIMSKLQEMRKAGLEVHGLLAQVKNLRAGDFHLRAALSESIAELRTKIRRLKEEDESTENLAAKYDSDLDKADADLDKADEAGSDKAVDALTDAICTIAPDLCSDKQDAVKKAVAEILKKAKADEEVDVSEILKPVLGETDKKDDDEEVRKAFDKGEKKDDSDKEEMLHAAESVIKTAIGRVKFLEAELKKRPAAPTAESSLRVTELEGQLAESKKLIKESHDLIEKLRKSEAEKAKLLKESADELDKDPVIPPADTAPAPAAPEAGLTELVGQLKDNLTQAIDRIVGLSKELQKAADLLGSDHGLDMSMVDTGEEAPPADVPPADVPPADVPPTDVPPTDTDSTLHDEEHPILESFYRRRGRGMNG